MKKRKEKQKNPAAQALGSLGGLARAKRDDLSELNRHAAIEKHRKSGHKLKTSVV